MNKYEQWFRTQSGGWDAIDPEDAWNAAINAAMETAINAAHPNDWIRIGMALEKLKS